MPSRHKQHSAYADDYFYDEDRDVRSGSRSHLRDRSERARYDNYRYVKPGQVTEARRGPNPQNTYFPGPWVREVKWSSRTRDREDDNEQPREPWTKRSLYKEAQRCSKFREGCSCCRGDRSGELRAKELRVTNSYHNSGGGAASKIHDFDEGEYDARESRRQASWTDSRPSRAEDAMAWTMRSRDRHVVDDMLSRAASDYESRKDRRIQGEWTMLRGRNGSKSRSHDDWEVLSTRSRS